MAGSPTDEPNSRLTDESTDEPTFDAVLEAAAVLDELPDLARVDAWASSVLGIWAEDPEAPAIDAHFVAWLAAVDHPRADAVARAVARLVEPADGAVTPSRAWEVDQEGVTSIGIAFVAEDGSEHSLLVDVIDGALSALIVAPGPDELFDGSEDLIDPRPIDVGEAAAAMVASWSALVERRQPPPDGVWVNGGIARARLAHLVAGGAPGFARPFDLAEATTPLDEAERPELDAWAVSVLDGAGVGLGEPGSPVLLDALDPRRIATQPAVEREAYEALEWADWLGVALGLCRAPVGTIVEPSMLIDLVNRCPEVTSTIPKRDRPYFEWAFSMVVPLWREAGVVTEDNELTEAGAAHLIHALRTAWAPVATR